MGAMEHRTQGRSGLKVSRLSLGAMTFGAAEGFMKGVTSSDDQARRVLDRALDAGIDTIDTANVYSEGRSEELLGKWRQGKVRYVGCSNYTGYRPVEALWTADRRGYEPFVSIQLQWSLAVRDAERELVPACRAFGLGTLVWSPLARGFLSGKYERGRPPPQGSRLSTWSESFKQFDNDRCWGVLDAVR